MVTELVLLITHTSGWHIFFSLQRYSISFKLFINIDITSLSWNFWSITCERESKLPAVGYSCLTTVPWQYLISWKILVTYFYIWILKVKSFYTPRFACIKFLLTNALKMIFVIRIPLHFSLWTIDLSVFPSNIQEIQTSAPAHRPIIWQDGLGVERASNALAVSYLADAPERSALTCQLSYSTTQGCRYCLQLAESIDHRMCDEYDPTCELKTHLDVVEQAERWEQNSIAERAWLLKEQSTKGFKKLSVVQMWAKFDLIKVRQSICFLLHFDRRKNLAKLQSSIHIWNVNIF